MEERVLLSICIPTYNRGEFLEKTLFSIACQRIFRESGCVEVVIADNGSTDNTRQVAKAFQARYPGKVRYSRTEQTSHSSFNFARVLRQGTGLLRKLHNDCLLLANGFLEEAVHLAREHGHTRPLVFFLNRNTPVQTKTTSCANLNDFVTHVSYFSTWIGALGVWREDVEECAALFDACRNHFAQVEWFFRSLQKGRNALVYNKYFCNAPKSFVKETRPAFLFGTFAFEYTQLLAEYRERGILDADVHTRELKRFFAGYLVRRFAQTGSGIVEFFKGIRTVPAYSHWRWQGAYGWYLVTGQLKRWRIAFIKNTCGLRAVDDWRLERRLQASWRRANADNSTALQLCKSLHAPRGGNMEEVSVDEGTYGAICALSGGALNEGLRIGRHVHIGEGVTFILGGEHPGLDLDAAPLSVQEMVQGRLWASYGPIVVGDGAWLGRGCTVYSGAHIGRGAHVAPGSVVRGSEGDI